MRSPVSRVADGHVDDLYERIAALNTVARDATAAQRLVREGRFGVTSSGQPDPPPAGPRYPRLRPRVDNAPAPDRRFVGRAGILDDMRDQLVPGADNRSPTVLLGQRGIGKTTLVKEYAHRFACDYDIVWWIEAAVPRQLAILGRRILPPTMASDVDELRSQDQEVEAIIDAMRRGEPHQRWLLVYDNAPGPDALRHLLPRTSPFGYVIVTSRDLRWEDSAPAIAVERFARPESLEYLGNKLRTTENVLMAVAKHADDVPIELAQACGWIRANPQPVNAAVEALLERTTVDVGGSRSTAWTLAYEQLCNNDDPRDPSQRTAARILKLCAVLSEQGVPACSGRHEPSSTSVRRRRPGRG